MSDLKYLIGICIVSALMLYAGLVHADERYIDHRICYNNSKNTDGSYKRDSQVPRKYQLIVPCPSTGLTTGACNGWSVDHVRPISRCGCDSVDNVQWLKNTIKSCTGSDCKDRWELKIYSCTQGNLK
jgi:hypothetical protein